jgi:predicted Ser/Thr protein kinase
MAHVPEEHWPRIPVGTQVAQWRVEAWQAQGAYGAIYRAVPMGQEHEGQVALKVSLYPWDWRFAREAELLSRLSHPSIPRLLGRGVLRSPDGAEYPWFAMEWVEGTPLYAWAGQHAPSHRHVCQLLAQLARALEALHAAGAVHRDVKGDNVLVRHSDGRAVLIDFGSGHFQGAERLTWQGLAPGTPAYRSAQACLFDIRSVRDRNSYYAPTPADDLFALGVTAYRLVMGEYPPEIDAQEDEQGEWRVASPDPRPLLENSPRVQPFLREWILRLLSDVPEERGSAAELAEALEAESLDHVEVQQPAEALAAEAPPPAVPVAVSAEGREERSRVQARKRNWRPWLALAAAAVLVVALWSGQQPISVSPEYVSASPPGEAQDQVPDAGTATVGDNAPIKLREPAQPPRQPESVAQEPPPELRPGQTRADGKGRCPGRKHVVFNGGCWVEQALTTTEECMESGYVLLKGRCYAPALEVPQKTVPTSSPGKAR